MTMDDSSLASNRQHRRDLIRRGGSPQRVVLGHESVGLSTEMPRSAKSSSIDRFGRIIGQSACARMPRGATLDRDRPREALHRGLRRLVTLER